MTSEHAATRSITVEMAPSPAAYMEAAEQFALSQGATNVSLDTFAYPARPFYEKLGYKLFGTLEGFPPGQRQYFLTKAIEPLP